MHLFHCIYSENDLSSTKGQRDKNERRENIHTLCFLCQYPSQDLQSRNELKRPTPKMGNKKPSVCVLDASTYVGFWILKDLE